MRRRCKPLPTDELNQQPPRELLRFVPSQAPPTTVEGRPMPWAVKWEPGEFASWLRARAAWRDTHPQPLPGLLARERHAMGSLQLPQGLVAGENAAPRT